MKRSQYIGSKNGGCFKGKGHRVNSRAPGPHWQNDLHESRRIRHGVLAVSYTHLERTLTDLGIKYEIVPVYDDTLEDGKVARTDKEVGEEISKDTDTVMIFIKAEGYESPSGSEGESASSNPYTKPWWKVD